VAEPTRRRRRDAPEPGDLQIEAVDKGINEADGIVGGNLIVDRVREKQQLRAIGSGDVSHTPSDIRQRFEGIALAWVKRFHAGCLKSAQP
jgi:hypothetical protein